MGRSAESPLQVALLVLALVTRQAGLMAAAGLHNSDGAIAAATSSRERLEVARQILTEVPLIDG